MLSDFAPDEWFACYEQLSWEIFNRGIVCRGKSFVHGIPWKMVAHGKLSSMGNFLP